MRPSLVVLLFPITLAACMTEHLPPPLPEPFPIAGDCGAGALSHYVGRPLTDLPALGPSASLRVIRPGMAVTRDYSATRLNAEVDGQGLILRLSCG